MNDAKIEKLKANRARHIRPDSKSGWLSLSSILGKGRQVVDLEGYIDQKFGDDSPVFHACNVVLEDGTRIHLEGEHDIAYIPYHVKVKGMTEKEFNALIDPDDLDADD